MNVSSMYSLLGRTLSNRRSAFVVVMTSLLLVGGWAVLLATTAPVLYAQDPTTPEPSTAPEVRPATVDEPDIRGGREAAPGAWPWQAALIYSYYDNAYSGQFCGGSLIDPEWVLTAAHCVSYASASDVDVVLGRHQLSLEDGERISVTDIVVHPDYRSTLFGGDIALLHLSRPSTQTVVSFDTNTVALAETRSLNATVTGWGATDDLYDGSDVLREVVLPLVSLETCRDAYYDYVTDEMICAGYEKGAKSACYGDSGGPLMIPGDSATGWTQVGVVSWGRSGCSGYDNYNVYTRVASHAEWIQECIARSDTSDCVKGDAFEPDDEPATASVIATDGISQTHNFHSSEDRDWLKFDAKAGTTYWIETFALGGRSDTILWLYDADGVTALGYNDDNSLYERASRLLWQAPADGTYYIQVDNHWQDRRASTEYSIMALPVASQLYLPIVNRYARNAAVAIEVPAEAVPVLTPVPTLVPSP